LQAVIDNYNGSDLVEIAYMKLNAIIASEKTETQSLEEQNIEPEDIVPEDLPQE